MIRGRSKDAWSSPDLGAYFWVHSVLSTPVSQSDETLLAAWAKGDKKAGDQLFERVFPILLRFFRNKVSLAEAEDLVQRSLETLVQKHERFRGVSSFTTFVIGIARIELLRHLRARHKLQKREGAELEVSIADLDPSPSAVAAKASEEKLLLAALRAIPVELQLVLELHYWEEMTMAEIAEVIEVPVGTAKSRMRRAKEKLEAVMGAISADPSLRQSTVSGLDDWAKGLRRT